METGMFGAHLSLVPLAKAEYRDGSLQVTDETSGVAAGGTQDRR